MKKKLFKYIKFLVSLTLILSLVAPSYASLSASDGSAFVTKAEFDSALADFNARLTTFEAGINSKIDSQVTSYLDRNGIWSGKAQDLLGDGFWKRPVVFFTGFDELVGKSGNYEKILINEVVFINKINKSGLLYGIYNWRMIDDSISCRSEYDEANPKISPVNTNNMWFGLTNMNDVNSGSSAVTRGNGFIWMDFLVNNKIVCSDKIWNCQLITIQHGSSYSGYTANLNGWTEMLKFNFMEDTLVKLFFVQKDDKVGFQVRVGFSGYNNSGSLKQWQDKIYASGNGYTCFLMDDVQVY